MKLPKSLYNILQYYSTINDAFIYIGNGYLIMPDKVGSGFVETKAPDYFFKEQVIIRSLAKFLRLFTYDKRDKAADPESIQDWTIGKTVDPKSGLSKPQMYLKSPGSLKQITQGGQNFADQNKKNLVSKFDNIIIEDPIKFQITSAQYKQIINDCSLLDLDTITISSESEDIIKIYLSKKDKGLDEDFSAYEIECHHEHKPIKIQIQLSSFVLIDATDHQLEFGKFLNKFGSYTNILKIRSFCDNNFVVNRVILGKGD